MIDVEWYAIFVETGKEEIVQKYLRLRFGESLISLVPKRVVTEKRNGRFYQVTKKLFPGYVFLHINLNNEVYFKVSSLPNVYRILKSKGSCISIKQEEMIPLLRLLNGKEIIEISQIEVNPNVKIVSGPLRGLEGLIKKINMHTRRVKIAVIFDGHERLIDLGIELLETV
ncbi:antiterminator LoaP [Paenibacillus oleatilyticus]|uniref:Transcription termination/antitermination protein NusG n=1 Tax=Paenibacillus oleatilyticus TaxID=2594886 RepID=A0ABV4VA51_9BACL